MTKPPYELRSFARKWNLPIPTAVAILRDAKTRTEANDAARRAGGRA